MWYEFISLEEFDVWHNDLCTLMGYPLKSVNQLTGQVDDEATMTTAYCEPILVNGKYIAFVEVEHAQGLTETELRVPKWENYE